VFNYTPLHEDIFPYFDNILLKAKVVPLHSTKALGGEEI
jgi:hypothetical protein